MELTREEAWELLQRSMESERADSEAATRAMRKLAREVETDHPMPRAC